VRAPRLRRPLPDTVHWANVLDCGSTRSTKRSRGLEAFSCATASGSNRAGGRWVCGCRGPWGNGAGGGSIAINTTVHQVVLPSPRVQPRTTIRKLVVVFHHLRHRGSGTRVLRATVNLDVIDVFGLFPQGFKQHICQRTGHQVLHSSFLCQIMSNPVESGLSSKYDGQRLLFQGACAGLEGPRPKRLFKPELVATSRSPMTIMLQTDSPDHRHAGDRSNSRVSFSSTASTQLLAIQLELMLEWTPHDALIFARALLQILSHLFRS